jgi:hypothetical protein
MGCVKHDEENIVVDFYTEPIDLADKLTSNKILIFKITHFLNPV